MTSAQVTPRSPWPSVALGFILAGAALRLLGFFSQGDLYVDDARVALSIATRSFGGLMRPLDYGQVAPLPFLWLEKAMTLVGGVNEHALRIIPLLASVVVVVLVWTVGRHAFGERPAIVATCLAALSTFAMSYASAVKQYSTDALVTLVIVWLVLDVLRAPDNHAAWLRLAVGGAAALWISQPSVFVLAGAALALPASAELRARPHWLRHYGLTCAAWSGVFLVLYLVVYRAGEQNAYLKHMWEWMFLSPGAPKFGTRVWNAARAILVPPIYWPGGALFGSSLVLGGLTSAAVIIGLASIYRTQGPPLALLCAGPYVAVLVAAMAGKYPLAERLLLFATPLLFFLYGSAACWAAARFPARARGAAVAAVVVLFTLWRYPAALKQARHPARQRQTKTLLKTIEARAPDAPVYLFSSGIFYDGSVWAFNTTDWNAPDTGRLRQFAALWDQGIAAQFGMGVAAPDVAALSSTVGRHREIIGVAAHIGYAREGIAWSQKPAAEWVAAESARIRRAANPRVWVWASELLPEDAITELLHGIRLLGGRLIFEGRVLGATAWEVEFRTP